LAAAQVGRRNEKQKSNGHALAINQWSVILAFAGDYTLSRMTSTVIAYDGDLEYPTTTTFLFSMKRI
jgi:hypothetical protein